MDRIRYMHTLKEAVIEETINYEMAKRMGPEEGDEEALQDTFSDLTFNILENFEESELSMSEYFIEYFEQNGDLVSSLYEDADNTLVNASCARAVRETLRKTSDHYGIKSFLFDLFVSDYERDALEEIREQGGIKEMLKERLAPERVESDYYM